MLGDIAVQFQKRDESVLKYANRIRHLGTRILEAERNETGAKPSAGFNADLTRTIIRTFKRGLLPEIKRATAEENDVQDLVQAAITAETELAAVRELRLEENHLDYRRRKIHATAPECSSDVRPKMQCEYCKMTNHSVERCYKRERDRTREQREWPESHANSAGQMGMWPAGVL